MLRRKPKRSRLGAPPTLPGWLVTKALHTGLSVEDGCVFVVQGKGTSLGMRIVNWMVPHRQGFVVEVRILQRISPEDDCWFSVGHAAISEPAAIEHANALLAEWASIAAAQTTGTRATFDPRFRIG